MSLQVVFKTDRKSYVHPYYGYLSQPEPEAQKASLQGGTMREPCSGDFVKDRAPFKGALRLIQGRLSLGLM